MESKPLPPMSLLADIPDTFTIKPAKNMYVHGKKAPLQFFGPVRLWVKQQKWDWGRGIATEPCRMIFKRLPNQPLRKSHLIQRIEYHQQLFLKQFTENPSQLDLDQGFGIGILHGELENESEIMEQLKMDEEGITTTPDDATSSRDLMPPETPTSFTAPSSTAFSEGTTIEELQRQLADRNREIYSLKNSIRGRETANSELLQYVARSR